jgi:cytochrome c551/c552
MNKISHSPFWAASAVLCTVVFAAGLGGVQNEAAAKAAGPSTAQGKTLTATYGCVGCHGADLKGKMGPSLASTGIMKQYTKAKFEKVLNTGVTVKGVPVHPPMPVFHMAKAPADDIYTYLKTIK